MQNLLKLLHPLYDRHEARALLRILVEDLCHEPWTHFVCHGEVSDSDRQTQLRNAVARLAEGEPIQHILGYATFCGHRFSVTKDTLIPRPETEELVGWITTTAPRGPLRILDIGTGSGCIAISLALSLPNGHITALDISGRALAVAENNWRELQPSAPIGAVVDFLRHDILSLTPPPMPPQYIIVSNPPYICLREAADMHPNVLSHDPHLALFVPDDDPLLFYRSIARHALTLLKVGGTLYFEINRAYATDIQQLLRSLGYADIELRSDQFGNPRMVKAKKAAAI